MMTREELDAKLVLLCPEDDDSPLVKFLIELDFFLEGVQTDEGSREAGLWQGPAISLRRVLLQDQIRKLREAQ